MLKGILALPLLALSLDYFLAVAGVIPASAHGISKVVVPLLMVFILLSPSPRGNEPQEGATATVSENP